MLMETFGAQVDPEAMAKIDALPLLEVELQLRAPELVWVPDLQPETAPQKPPDEPTEGSAEAPSSKPPEEPRPLVGPPHSVRSMWSTWVATLLHVNSRVARLDGAEGEAFFGLWLAPVCCRCGVGLTSAQVGSRLTLISMKSHLFSGYLPSGRRTAPQQPCRWLIQRLKMAQSCLNLPAACHQKYGQMRFDSLLWQ